MRWNYIDVLIFPTLWPGLWKQGIWANEIWQLSQTFMTHIFYDDKLGYDIFNP